MDDRAAVQGALVSSQPPVQRDESEIGQLRCEFDHFHSYSVKVKNEWGYTSIAQGQLLYKSI